MDQPGVRRLPDGVCNGGMLSARRNPEGVVLDESSILKNFTGKTRQRLTQAFAETPYRLCCTATPSPATGYLTHTSAQLPQRLLAITKVFI